MPEIRLNILGGFELLRKDGKPVSVPARKARALLAYLALQSGGVATRDQLALLLWPEADHTQGRHSLRQLLSDLRRALPVNPAVLRVDSERIALVGESVSVDAVAFEGYLEQGDRDDLIHASVLYRGDLLEGLDARSPEFDDWVGFERSRLRDRALGLLERVLSDQLAQGKDASAVQTSLRILALDALREPVYRSLMKAYARSGQYASALKVYRGCRRVLQQELGVGPDAETVALYREILLRRDRPAAAPTVPEVSVPDPPSADPERLRPAAILVAELVGFDDWSQTVDPETQDDVLTECHRLAEPVVARFGGRVLSSAQHCLMAGFGLDGASGNEVERAAQVALSLAKTAAGWSFMAGSGMDIRLGLDTGRVRHRGDRAGPALAGAVIGAAQRLAEAAEPGAVLLSEAARQAGRGSIRVSPAAAGASPSAWRLDGLQSADTPDTAFIGRTSQCLQFSAMVAATQETGQGHVLLLRGEPGIGKTRLSGELSRLAESEGFRVDRASVLDFGQRTDQCLEDLAAAFLGLEPWAGESDRREALAGALASRWLEPDREPFINDLLHLAQPERWRALHQSMGADVLLEGRSQSLAALARRACETQPRLVIVDDLHWASADVLQAMATLGNAVVDAALLLVLTSRLEGQCLDPAWRGALAAAPLSTLDLGPLREQEALEVARELSNGDAEFLRRCVDRAGGNPLFLEQLLAARTVDDSLPESVVGIVATRIDALTSRDRHAVSAASVLGQRFTLDSLRAVMNDPDYAPLELLSAGLVRLDAGDYRFAHALVTDGVYQTLLRADKQTLHRRAAAWFAQREPVLAAEHLERVADSGAAAAFLVAARALADEMRPGRATEMALRGVALSEDPEVLYPLWSAAGEQQVLMGKTEDALRSFEAAARVACGDKETASARLGAAVALSVLDQHEAALEVLAEAERLLGPQGDTDLLARLHHHRGNVLFPLGRIEDCLASHETAHGLAAQVGSVDLMARALSGLGDAYYQRGQMLTAYDYFHRCVKLCETHGLFQIAGANQAMRGIAAVYAMRMTEGIADLNSAVERARARHDLRGEMLALDSLATVLFHVGDHQGQMRSAQASLVLVERLGARRFEAENVMYLSLATANLGDLAAARDLIERALELASRSGLEFMGPPILATQGLLAENEAACLLALSTGEALLPKAAIGHNHLHFRQLAMEACMAWNRWDEVIRHGDCLEDYCRPEPLPWSAFFVARARLLAATAGGERGAAHAAALRTVLETARKAGLILYIPALEDALGTVEGDG